MGVDEAGFPACLSNLFLRRRHEGSHRDSNDDDGQGWQDVLHDYAESDRTVERRVRTGAGEVMSVVQTAMLAKLPHTALRDAILAHPTLAEGLTVLFAAVPAFSKTAA